MAEEKKVERPRVRRAKRKVCAFCVDKVDYIDYKDVAKLRRFFREESAAAVQSISVSSLLL